LRHRIALLLAAALAGVSLAADSQVADRLEQCVKLYESGEYVQAVDHLNSLFPVLPERLELRAYKFLAFSYTMLQMTDRAAMVFNAALDRYPGMALDTLEAPPRIISLFQEVRQVRRQQTPPQLRAQSTVQVAMGTLMLMAAGGGLFASGYLLGSSDESASVIGGAALGAVSAILLPVSVFVIRKPDQRKKKRLALRWDPATSPGVVAANW
jgi:hypothetical protein